MAAADKDQEGPRCPGAGLSLGVPSRSRPGRVGGRPRCWNHDHDPQQRGSVVSLEQSTGSGGGSDPRQGSPGRPAPGLVSELDPISLHVVTASPRPAFCPVPLGRSPLLAGTAQMPRVEKGSADHEALSALGGTGRRLPVSTSVCGGRALMGGRQDLLGACAHVCVCPCCPTHHREVTEDHVQPC